MAGLAESIATRGVICNPIQQLQIIDQNRPVIQQTLEVRPIIRHVTGSPDPVSVVPPVTKAAIEIKPTVTQAQAPTLPDPDPKPTNTAVIELRPVVKSAEEE